MSLDRYGDEIDPANQRQKRSTATDRRTGGSPRPPSWEVVDAGTLSSICRGKDCQKQIYWIQRPGQRKGRPTGKLVRVPVDVSVDGGMKPTQTADGRGINHFSNCVNAGRF